ncbi:MAG TPA: pilin, partial [Steroidobacteraceae bacterium]|nr:pilin [Steroidobacteraceae bacterium]
KLVEDLPPTVVNVPDQRRARLERHGGTSPGAAAGVLVGVGFLGIGMLGILAAIAIPAYQDYTIRAQVTEGLNLASQAKLRVADYWQRNSAWPQQADLGSEAPIGKYVTSVEVDTGSVVITYGNAANSNIAGKRLVLLPGLSNDGELVWACANAPLPEGVRAGDGPYGSEVPDKYLPSACRAP